MAVNDIAKYALEQLMIGQKALKMALAVYDGRTDRAEEIIVTRDRLAMVDWLIGLAEKEDSGK